MDGAREDISVDLLTTGIVDTDLRIRDTTTESGFRVPGSGDLLHLFGRRRGDRLGKDT